MDAAAVGNGATSLLSGYLHRRLAGAPAEPATDALYRLVSGRLGASAVGQRALHGFAAAPQDPGTQAALAVAITGEAARDPAFGAALAQALHPVQPPAGSPTPWPTGEPRRRSALSPGWIVAIVAGVMVVIAGVTAAVLVAVNQESYSEIAGAWVPEPTEEAAGALVLRIEGDGNWRLDGLLLVSQVSCTGQVTRGQGSVYTLRVDAGICTDFWATLDGDVLVVNSSDQQSVRWVRQTTEALRPAG